MAVVTLFQSKREQFVGDDGIPLSNGRLYIGEPNEDPKVSTLTVYSDRAKTSPIDQSSGIPLDAEGRTTVSVWIDQSYSYVVDDAAGNEVITEPYIEVVDVAELVQEEVDTLSSALATGYRNSNINGGMQVVRDGVGPVAITSAFAEGQVSGAFGRATNVSAGTMEQGTDAALGVTGNHFLFNGVTLPGASDYIEFQERYQSQEALRYVNRSATASFLVRHDFGTLTDFSITVSKADSLDNFSSITTIDAGTEIAVAPGVGTVISFTVDDMGDCSNGIAVTLKVDAGQIVTKNLAITSSQLEQSAVRTAFEARQYKDAKSAIDADAFISHVPRGYLDGCEVSKNTTDPDHDIDIAAGVARDSTDGYTFDVSAITKRLDASWAEGTNAGGFPSGLTLSADTWYRVFLIGKTDGTVDAGFDTSATATNLLSDATGYTLYRQIGWVRTDGSENIRPFRQDGDYFFFDAPYQQAGWTISTTATAVEVGCPPSCVALVSFEVRAGAGNTLYFSVRHPDAADVAPTSSSYTFTLSANASESNRGSIITSSPVNGSSQIEMRASSTGGDVLSIMSLGWIDKRAA